MRFLWIFTILLSLTCGCALVDSPKEVAVELDITLEQLEKKMLEARDPKLLFSKATSYVQRQVLTQGNTQYLVFVSYLAPDKYKIETFKDNQPFNSIILNANSAWYVDYEKRVVTNSSPEDVDRLKTMMKLGDPNSSYQQLFKEVKLTQCKIDGLEYYKMQCIPKHKNSPEMTIYIGQESYLIRSIDIAKLKYHSTIDRYSLFEGVIIPEQTTVTVNGKVSSSIINLNKLNVPLEKSNFLPPIFNPEERKE